MQTHLILNRKDGAPPPRSDCLFLHPSPGSTSKAGGVRFPDDDEPPGSPTRRDDQSKLSSLLAAPEQDGSFLVKVSAGRRGRRPDDHMTLRELHLPLPQAGFLKSHHTYEVVFTLPEVPAPGRELSTAPSSSPSRRAPNLRVQRISSTLEGESRTQQTPPSGTTRSPSPRRPDLLLSPQRKLC